VSGVALENRHARASIRRERIPVVAEWWMPNRGRWLRTSTKVLVQFSPPLKASETAVAFNLLAMPERSEHFQGMRGGDFERSLIQFPGRVASFLAAVGRRAREGGAHSPYERLIVRVHFRDVLLLCQSTARIALRLDRVGCSSNLKEKGQAMLGLWSLARRINEQRGFVAGSFFCASGLRFGRGLIRSETPYRKRPCLERPDRVLDTRKLPIIGYLRPFISCFSHATLHCQGAAVLLDDIATDIGRPFAYRAPRAHLFHGGRLGLNASLRAVRSSDCEIEARVRGFERRRRTQGECRNRLDMKKP